MKPSTLKKALVGPLLLMILVSACEPSGTDGERGVFRFFDMTPDIFNNNMVLDRPIGVGKTMVLEMDGASGPVEAAFSNTRIAEVIDIDTKTPLTKILIRGLAPGVSTLEVKDNAGNSDRIELKVADAKTTELYFLPWQSPVLPQDLYGKDMVLLPDAIVDIVAVQRDSEGTPLSGFSDEEWSSSDGAVVITNKENSDFATLRSKDKIDTVEIEFGGHHMSFPVVPEDTIDRLEIVDINTGERGTAQEEIVLESGLNMLSLSAFDSEGRYVMGRGLEPLSVEQSAQLDVLRVLQGPERRDDKFAQNRTFLVHNSSPGSATLTLTWLGQSHTFDVRVVEKAGSND
jgi:hypothetical protein